MRILVLFFALFLPSKATEPWIELAAIEDASVRFAADNRDRFFDLKGHSDGKVPPEAVGLRVHGLHVKEWAGICRTLRDLKSLSIESSEAHINQELISEIRQIKGLRYLTLKFRRVGALGPEIGMLTNLSDLRYLGLVMTKLTNVTSDVFGLSTVENLRVSFGDIKLPDGISRMQNLKSALIVGRPVRRLPSDLADCHLASLDLGTIVGLNQNLQVLPQALVRMSLVNSDLVNVPPEWSKCSKLVYLELAANRIEVFPAHLLNSPSLRYLGLDDNAITELPDLGAFPMSVSRISVALNPLKRISPDAQRWIDKGVITR
jgi:Leucine-rich repeat (LRR) protein